MTTGIISGIISAVLVGFGLFVVRAIWKLTIEPWYENKLYSDARIDGTWTAVLEAQVTEPDREVVTILQTGHHISGEMRCASGPDEGRIYEFTGVVRNLVMSGYYWNTDKRSIDSGSFSLRLEEDGTVLSGHTVYYNDTDNELLSRPYRWTRDMVAK